LEGEAVNGQYITDPELLKLLNAPGAPAIDPAILAQLEGAPPPAAPNERGVLDRLGHAAGVTYRAMGQGAASGVMGLPALVADSVMGVGRDIGYGGKLLLSKAGVTEAPDPANYYSRENFPMTNLALKAGAALPDAVGLPKPENASERIASAGIEGLYSGGAGVGLGLSLVRAGARAPGAFLAANPKSSMAAGTLGGVGSQTAAEQGATGEGQVASGIALSTLPMLWNMRSGRVTSGTDAGQRAIAGQVLRDVAENPTAAAANLDRAGNTRIAGFEHFGSNASRDLGIAAVHKPMREWANEYGGQAAAIEERNSSILSRALDARGARPGTAEATRALATDAAQTDISRMGLAGLPREDTTQIVRDLERASDMRTPGVRTASAQAAREMRDAIVAASYPAHDAAGNFIGWRTNPDRLHSIRQDFNSPPPPGSGVDRLSGLRMAGRLTRDTVRQIDDLLGGATLGEYPEYLARQRTLRSRADSQEFMRDIADSTSKDQGAFRTRTGDREILPGSFMARMGGTRIDRPVAGGSRNMSVERLGRTDPISRQMLGDIQSDLNDASFVNQRGIATRGSNTQQIADIKDMIATNVAEHRGPLAKAMAAVLPVVDASTSAIGRIAGPMPHAATRSALGAVRNALTGRVETATQGVQRHLGAAEANPAFMAELLRSEPITYPGYVGPAVRGAARASRFGYEGFLAGERASRYR
jgi:hypothetical protein